MCDNRISTINNHSNYELLTSIRYDPYLLGLKWNNDCDGPSTLLLSEYHYSRLREAASLHHWEDIILDLTYDTFKRTCKDAAFRCQDYDSSKSYKIRVTLARSGKLEATASDMTNLVADPMMVAKSSPPSEPESGTYYAPFLLPLPIAMDFEATPSSLFTITKTTKRSTYDCARLRRNIGAPRARFADVLLHNKEDIVTETTIYNVAFWRSPHWITPHTSAGCLPGVMRRWLLDQKIIQEAKTGTIKTRDIKDGEWVLLFNGVQGCKLGIIREQE